MKRFCLASLCYEMKKGIDSMLKIGCHMSTAKGFANVGRMMEKIGANSFQFFTRNPRGGSVKEWDDRDISAYLAFADSHGFVPPLAHAPYTLNPCAKDEALRKFAFETMEDDLKRLQKLPGSSYNFHPGSHVGQGSEKGIEYIADMLNRLSDSSTTILLETMAGKGTEVGRSFEELRTIIDKVENKEKLGVCLDTCHVFDSGYDIVSQLDTVLEEFDRVIGLERLKAIHLNDSMNVLGSRKDRHEKLGKGNIGLDAFTAIINHERLRELPFYLETPNELDGYADEIALLKKLYQEK